MPGTAAIEKLLARARAGLDRVPPERLAAEVADGAVVVDIRPVEQRRQDGDLPGAVVIDRNVLEWRLDPTSAHRSLDLTAATRVVVVCNEGYASSLAAATLRELGLPRATDLVGGYQAWRTLAAAQHWDEVFRTKDPPDVSWHQVAHDTSLALVADTPGSVIDVGAGCSTLVDDLLAAGRADVTVLDISAEALALTRQRLEQQAELVTFEVGDIRAWEPQRTYDVWHDRAVFHFLTAPGDRSAYVAVVTRAISHGGALVLGTFAEDGPTQCSGLPTARYNAADLADLFAAGFDLEHQLRETHETPAGTEQPFTWVRLRRRP